MAIKEIKLTAEGLKNYENELDELKNVKRKEVSEKITEEKAEESIKDGNLLFVTATCPNCKIACATLDKAGVEYTKIYANEQPDFAKEMGIKQAPTLVVIKDGQAEKFSGVSDIKKHLS